MVQPQYSHEIPLIAIGFPRVGQSHIQLITLSRAKIPKLLHCDMPSYITILLNLNVALYTQISKVTEPD